MNLFDETYKKRLLWFLCAVFGGGLIVICLMHIGAIFSAAIGVLKWICGVLTGFIAGFVVAYLLLPVVEWLQKLLMKTPIFKNKAKAARGLGIAATYVLIFVAIFSVLSAVAVAITKQVQTINFADLPALVQKLQIQAKGLVDTMLESFERFGIPTDDLRAWINDLENKFPGNLSTMGNGVLSFADGARGFFSNALFAVIFSIYFLFDTEGLLSYWSRAFRSILGSRIHGSLAILIKDADTCFSGYIRGQLADAAFMAVAVGIILSIIGVPYALAIGVCSGIGNLIPYVGPFVAYGLTLGICIAAGQWKALVIALIALFILQTIDGNVINPKLLSQSIDIHPVLVIVGLLFGSSLGGFWGMLLAVPVASFIKIQFERIIQLNR